MLPMPLPYFMYLHSNTYDNAAPINLFIVYLLCQLNEEDFVCLFSTSVCHFVGAQ